MASPDVTVGAIFGPQHGFRSDVQDNMIETPHANDCRRKVPVFSLYSETREPTSDMLRHVDVMVIDLQDIGARIYTYIYTMANCLRACAKHGVDIRSEEHTSELQSQSNLVCRLLLEKKKEHKG